MGARRQASTRLLPAACPAGHGLAYNGEPFINPGGGRPVYFGQPTAQQPAVPTPLRPARKVPVASGGLYMINLNFGNCRVDDISDYVSAAQPPLDPLTPRVSRSG
jgi:hypothetical protein